MALESRSGSWRALRLGVALTVATVCSTPGLGQQPCPLTRLGASDPDGGDRFGWSVAVAGEVLVAGGLRHDHNGLNSGAAYVFRRAGTAWSFEQELLASDGAAQDRFGWAVDTDGTRIVVGARTDDDPVAGADAGSAYVFVWNGATWIEEQKLTALDAQAGDELGTSVALAGARIVLGADGEDAGGAQAGAAYVFERSGSTWTQDAKLVASDAAAGADFGTAVSVDGPLVAVGAPLDSEGGSLAGAAYVFRAGAVGWSEEAKLLPADLATNDRFGSSVSLSGTRVLVGAMNAPTMGANDSGAAYVFASAAGTWSEEHKLEAADSALGDLFGWTVALDGDAAVVGAYLEDEAGADAGAAYLFSRAGGSWSQRAKVVADDTSAADAFGFSVDLDGDRVSIGAWGDDELDGETGSVYLFSWAPSVGVNYCSGEPSSAGPGASLSATGSALVAEDDFHLTARCVVPGVPGLFFLGDAMVDVPFGEGRRCAGGMVLRLNPPTFANPAGTAQRTVDLSSPPAAGNILPGSAWNAQFWYRDQAGGPAGFNLSDAVHVEFR